MNNLINILNKDGQLVVTSRQIADDFEKRNSHVVEAIENKIKSLTAENSEVNISRLFIPSTYNHNGNEYKEYLLTRDGFTFIVMGFTGAKADSWKLKYIEAFNKMEEKIKNPLMGMSKELQAVFILDKKTQEIETRVNDLEDNMPLFNIECKELQSLVRKVGIKALGGYKTPAYEDRSLRGKVYADIQHQLKREFGVNRYEAIKRSQLDAAARIVENYKVPLVLETEIESTNNQISM